MSQQMPVKVVVPKKSTYPHEQLRDALMFAQDIFERADMPFYLWGDTLVHVMNEEEELTGDAEVTIAVRRPEWTKEHVSLLEHWGGEITEINEKAYGMVAPNKIPIVIHIIEDDHKVLRYPDFVHYWIETFRVPNPYNEFVKVKDEIV